MKSSRISVAIDFDTFNKILQFWFLNSMVIIYFLVKLNKHNENEAEIEYCFYGKSE